MLNKKIITISAAILTIVALTLSSVPAVAADLSPAQTSQAVPQAGNIKPLLRLMLIQDASKVDEILTQATVSGKISVVQAAKIKDFWTQHHVQFARNAVLKKLLSLKDGARVQGFLNQAVKAGKMKQEQADKILQIWKILHAPAANVK